MCYSAQIWSDYRKYMRADGAEIDFEAFVALLRRRQKGEKLVIPRGVTNAFKFCEPESAAEAECRDLVREYDSAQVPQLHELLNGQCDRLAKAQASLALKPTKKAREDQRIATNKIADLQRRLDDLERTDPLPRDDRIFAGNYCPVLTQDQEGQLIVRPMRYQCRPAGKPAIYDTKFPGTYYARRDSLRGFWKDVFGQTHAVVIATAFFEHVKRHALEQRPLGDGETAEDVVLRFYPREREFLPLACLWSHWRGKDEPDLLSFALITDEPPEEVAAAGHDRCPVPLIATDVARWLAPGATTDAYEALLQDKDAPFYEHQAAA